MRYLAKSGEHVIGTSTQPHLQARGVYGMGRGVCAAKSKSGESVRKAAGQNMALLAPFLIARPQGTITGDRPKSSCLSVSSCLNSNPGSISIAGQDATTSRGLHASPVSVCTLERCTARNRVKHPPVCLELWGGPYMQGKGSPLCRYHFPMCVVSCLEMRMCASYSLPFIFSVCAGDGGW